ncbi:MAG TPA: FAD-dependent oxidoreductase [Hyphomicrobiaceae bacterium]|nr:FAD-dependent oxidoreductase [Hyphomicrobiaceae bacterium]
MARARLASLRRERLVVVGGGMAACRLVEELVGLAPDRYDVTLVGKEPHPPYNRVLLSSLLAGDAEAVDLELRPPSWYAEHGVEVMCRHTAVAIDAAACRVELGHGERLAYDRLVLATGSNAVRLPIPGAQLPGVAAFRDLADADLLRATAPGGDAVVIGGGLLGIEAACGLARRGLAVTLVHLMPRLMERQLDAPAAAVLKSALARQGIAVMLEAETAAIEGAGRAERVILKDGRALPADLVVMTAGVRPETALARAAGLAIGRGILVDDGLGTSCASIFAIGECAEHRSTCYGLVEPVHEQARVLALRLAGQEARYEGSLPATSLKVSGIPVFSIGDFEGVGAETLVLEDGEAGVYRKLVLRGDRLCGAVLIGDTSDALWYRELVRRRPPLGAMRPLVAFGQALAEAA